MWSLSEWNTGFRNFGQMGDQFGHFFFNTSVLGVQDDPRWWLGTGDSPEIDVLKKKWANWSPTWPKFRKPVFHSDKLHIISNGRKISEFGFLFSFSRSGSIRLRVRVQNPVILELCFRKMIHLGDQISNNIDPDLENETKNQNLEIFPALEILWSLS